MSFQESRLVMKPARVIKMQDGHRRPPGGSNLGDRKRAKFFSFSFFFSLSQNSSLVFPRKQKCLLGIGS